MASMVNFCCIILYLEMMGPGFLIFWVGVGALFAMVASIFTDNVTLQFAIFIISSVVLLFCTRPFTKYFTRNDTTVTNARSVVGKSGIVVKEINPLNGTGQIKVDGEIWSAKSSKGGVIKEGSKVTISKINGVKAIVETAEENSTL